MCYELPCLKLFDPDLDLMQDLQPLDSIFDRGVIREARQGFENLLFGGHLGLLYRSCIRLTIRLMFSILEERADAPVRSDGFSHHSTKRFRIALSRGVERRASRRPSRSSLLTMSGERWKRPLWA